jgi:hypothetical protein
LQGNNGQQDQQFRHGKVHYWQIKRTVGIKRLNTQCLCRTLCSVEVWDSSFILQPHSFILPWLPVKIIWLIRSRTLN